MNNLQQFVESYLEYCKYPKGLNAKTLEAYRIDLWQFTQKTKCNDVMSITPAILEGGFYANVVGRSKVYE